MKLMRWQTPTLAQWPAFDRLPTFHNDIDALFESPFVGFSDDTERQGDWVPAVDVYQDEDKYTVKAELPGMTKEDISVWLHDGTLILAGERKREVQPDQGGAHRVERAFGRFERSVSLPDEVQADKVKADYREGILTVTLPKAEEAKPKRIEVKVR